MATSHSQLEKKNGNTLGVNVLTVQVITPSVITFP